MSNKTSEAVREYLWRGVHVPTVKESQDIAAKYQEFEKALRLISNNTTDETAQQLAAEALALDPLSA